MIIIIIIIKKESTLYDYHYSDNYNTFDQKISFDFWLLVIIMGSMYDNYDNIKTYSSPKARQMMAQVR